MPTLSSTIVKHQIASMRDVEEALARQVLYGGDLATNLLELAAVSERALTGVLAESHELEPGPIGELPTAAETTRRLVPGDIALRQDFIRWRNAAARWWSPSVNRWCRKWRRTSPSRWEFASCSARSPSCASDKRLRVTTRCRSTGAPCASSPSSKAFPIRVPVPFPGQCALRARSRLCRVRLRCPRSGLNRCSRFPETPSFRPRLRQRAPMSPPRAHSRRLPKRRHRHRLLRLKRNRPHPERQPSLRCRHRKRKLRASSRGAPRWLRWFRLRELCEVSLAPSLVRRKAAPGATARTRHHGGARPRASHDARRRAAVFFDFALQYFEYSALFASTAISRRARRQRPGADRRA